MSALRRFMMTACAVVFAGTLTAAEPKRVLLVTHSGGFVHNSVVTAEKVLTEIAPKHNMVVTTYRYTGSTDDPGFEKYKESFKRSTGETVEAKHCGRVNKDTLKQFDCVLFFTTGSGPQKKNLSPLTPEELTDLKDWVKAGGAFCGTHCASDTLYETPYGELIGGYFKTHPPGLQTIKVKVEDPSHPAAAGFTDGMTYKDEMYIFTDSPYSREKVRVILSIDPSSFNPAANAARKDKDYAISWVKDYGKGKVFYTSFGHDKKVWEDERFQKHLTSGMKWAMGELKGDAKPTTTAVKD
jgi:type 1 glutamine amidotransferase